MDKYCQEEQPKDGTWLDESVQDQVRSAPLVIFDFDGTLANTMPGIIRTARTVLRDWGMTDEQIGDLRRIVGPPFPQAFTMVYGVSEEDARTITARYRKIYEGLGPEGWPAFPGIPELLQSLRGQGKKLAIASSKRRALVERSISQNGLGRYFDVVSGKLTDGRETKADAIQRTLSAMGFTSDDAVMVGDRHFDVDAAHEVDVPCVGVHYGKTCEVEELVGAGACAIAETTEGLGRILLG